ncbi:zinc finger protein-like 1 [Microplitis demolitor]|uniref:zinc finger protein-like 1 n=1 Tax=Microplitis demolitor TaxID=69319 RepID=UPI0004CDD1F0|nr:zinc finger protein-like 1 [Microplitis demolitor]
MGLCKCPKRKVTNQFCFEHRVNVCEHCMVTNHPKCVVQSYLQWLQDSDCNPICTLCSNELKNGDCVRLVCYHVYHWPCLDQHARSLPSTTAPAGYVCPTCKYPIFPAPNLVSPVADVLKEKLVSVNWARAGLGLPLLSNDRESLAQESKLPSIETTVFQNHVPPPASPSVATARTSSNVNSINTHINNVHSMNNNSNHRQQGPPYSVVNMESTNQLDRKIFATHDDSKNMSIDHDENKYQRRPALDRLLHVWKLLKQTKKDARRRGSKPESVYTRYAILAVIGIVSFIFIIMIFSWLGNMATDGDPAFDVMSNPNLNLHKEPAI